MYHSNIGTTTRRKPTGVPSHNSLASGHFSEPFKSGFVTDPDDGPIPLLDLGSSAADFGPRSGNLNIQDSYEGYGQGAEAIARWKTTKAIIDHIKESQTWPVSVFLPLMKTNHLIHEFQVIEFNPALLDPLADEAAPRMMTFTRRQGKAYLRAFGKAIDAEIGFHLTPEGQQRWIQKMEALSSTVARTITVMALLELSQSPAYESDTKPVFVNGMPASLLRDEIIKEIQFFGALQKKRGGINTIISALKTILSARGVTGNAVAFGLGTERYSRDVTDDSVSVHHSELIQITGGNSPEHQDGMSNVFGVGQYYMCDNKPYLNNETSKYESSIAATQIYDMDAGLFVTISQEQRLRACGFIDYSTPELRLTPELGAPFFGPYRTWGAYLDSLGVLNKYADLLAAYATTGARYSELKMVLIGGERGLLGGGAGRAAAAPAAGAGGGRAVAGRVGIMPRLYPPHATYPARSIYLEPFADAELAAASLVVDSVSTGPAVAHTIAENRDVYVTLAIALTRARRLFEQVAPAQDVNHLVCYPVYPTNAPAAADPLMRVLDTMNGANAATVVDAISAANVYVTGGAAPGRIANDDDYIAAINQGVVPMPVPPAGVPAYPTVNGYPVGAALRYALPSEADWARWVNHVVFVMAHLVDAIQRKVERIRQGGLNPASAALLKNLALVRQTLESTVQTGTAAILFSIPRLRDTTMGSVAMQKVCDELVATDAALTVVLNRLRLTQRVAEGRSIAAAFPSRALHGAAAPAAAPAAGTHSRVELIALLYDSPIFSGAFLQYLNDANIPIPLNFLLLRPQIFVSASCAFIGTDGGALGNTFYTGERFETGMDPVHSRVYGKLSMKTRPKVMDTRLMARINGVHINRYMFGGGTKLWHCTDDDRRRYNNQPGGIDRPSIFVIALPLGETVIDRAISIDGSLSGFMGADEKMHYSTAPIYKRFWGWSNREIEKRRMLDNGIGGPDFTDASLHNVIVTRGAHRINRATGNGTWAMDEISSADSSHLGPTYPGCEAVMNGTVQYFENDRANV